MPHFYRRADCYRNLSYARKDPTIRVWSIRVKGYSKEHVRHMLVRDATFHVSQAGRKRVIGQQKRNVHAVVRGEVVAFCNCGDKHYDGCPVAEQLARVNKPERPVHYDPYVHSEFQVDGQDFTEAAPLVHFDDTGCWV